MGQHRLNTGSQSRQTKADPRMPFQHDPDDMMTGYISPQMHKSLKRAVKLKKRKIRYE